MIFFPRSSTSRWGGHSVSTGLLVMVALLCLGLSGCGSGGGGGFVDLGPDRPPVQPDPGNDTRAGAVPIDGRGGATGGLTAGDTDYFRITVDRPGTLAVSESGGFVDTNGQLEDANGTVLIRNEHHPATGIGFYLEYFVDPGTYYIRVWGEPGHYNLSVKFYADDYSNTPENATRTNPGQIRRGILTTGDTDYFVFTVHREGTVEIFADSGEDTFGRLEDAFGMVLASNDDAGVGDVIANYRGDTVRIDGKDFRIVHSISAGTYYVGVSGRNLERPSSNPANYLLLVDFRPASPIENGDTPDGELLGAPEEASRFEAGSYALSRVARSLGMSAISVMNNRGQAADGSTLTLAGHPMSFAYGSDSAKFTVNERYVAGTHRDWTRLEGSQRTGTSREFLQGSSFNIAVGDEMRAWGEVQGVSGSDESRFLGFERSFGDRLVAGIAFSDTATEGNLGLAESESLEASLASAYQYLHFSPGASTELWSLVGTGQGELSLADDIGTVETDLSMQMLAFGSSHSLAPLVAGFAPTVSADGFLVRLESVGRAELSALAGDASRLRTGVLFERPPEGDGWTPKIGFGVRHEDDERGVATRTEVMAGFGYVRDRLRVEGMTYYRPAGAVDAEAAGGDFEERDSGARLTAHYRAGPDGRGLAVSVDALAGSVPDAPVWESNKAASASSRVHLQAGYGIPWGLGRWMPYGAVQLDGDERRLREGVRHDIGALSLDIYGEHQLGATPEHGIHIGITTRY